MARVKNGSGDEFEETVLTDAEDDNTDHYVVISRPIDQDDDKS